MTYYKYRSLNNLKFFLDILLNKRLYTSKYSELNDPMEGFFTYDKTVPKDVINTIRAKRDNTYICSLSKRNDIGLMWSMYADEHKGCCIEVEVTAKSWQEIDVKYSSTSSIIKGTKDADMEKILSIKSLQWQYEEEVRFVKETSKRERMSIKIKKIYLGINMTRTEKAFYKNLITSIDKKIEVISMKKDDIDFGFKS